MMTRGYRAMPHQCALCMTNGLLTSCNIQEFCMTHLKMRCMSEVLSLLPSHNIATIDEARWSAISALMAISCLTGSLMSLKTVKHTHA